MAEYRKKPVVIEAVLWDGQKLSEVTPWISEGLEKHFPSEGAVMRTRNDVEICNNGSMIKAHPGDYIIRGVNGEIYPCPPDVFEKTYDKA